MPRVGLTIVVLADILDDVVLVLMFRLCCRDAFPGDLGMAELVGFTAVLFVWVVVFVFRTLGAGDAAFDSGRVARARASSIIALRGLAGFNGEVGRDMYDAFVGDVMSGDCLYVREFDDFGERTFVSASRSTCETDRGWPDAAGLPRFFGLSSGICASGTGAFSLSE